MNRRCDVRDHHSCTGCGACVQACPHQAMRMCADAEGFLYPRIDRARCTRCGLCRRICPVDRALPKPWQTAEAGYCTQEDLREASSSGGIFSILAERVLERDGIVWGAAFDERFALRHIGVERIGQLSALRGSKYLQSDVGDAYTHISTALKAGRQVLFSGTPCQVAGLHAALRGASSQEGLLTVDMVCHGVPSPRVFAASVRALEARYRQRIQRFSFRDKRRGWKDFCVAAAFEDGSEYVAGQTEDPYMIAFLRNFCLRPSCHACPYAGEKRQADLTLADLWGAQRVLPGWDDDRGFSLVLVGSERGAAAIDAVRSRFRSAPVDASALARDNPSIFRASAPHPRRAAFMRHVRKRGFAGIEKAFFAPPGAVSRALAKARRIPGAVCRRMLRGHR